MSIAASTLVSHVSEIVSAFLSRNEVSPDQVPGIILGVHGSLASLDAPPAPAGRSFFGRTWPEPAVPPRKSVFPGHVVCLIDGKRFKSMKRHLSKYGLTPAQYRTVYGLAADYPMVCPDYSAERSALALASGLGRKGDVDPVD